MTVTESPPETTERADARGSLKPVLDIIPDSAYDNPTWRGLFYAGRDLLVYAVLVVALVLVSHPLLVALLMVPTALAVSALFIVGHDALVRIVALIGLSVPNFLLGTLLILFISLQWPVLPTTGFVPLSDGLWPNLKSLVLPVISFLCSLVVMTVTPVAKRPSASRKARGSKQSVEAMRSARLESAQRA